MQIKYIDGFRFSRAIMAGARRVFDRQDYLNKINVYPVPDADTGTNMAATLRAMVQTLSGHASPSITSTSKLAAESALLGAHGNSGVILAQFFYGLSNEMGNEIRMSTDRFGKAVKNAIHYAYEALTHPEEGTILSVIKDWAMSVYENRQRERDFSSLLEHSLQAARKSLAKTKTTLQAMRSARVVDAGAQGFVDFMEGVVHFISQGRLRDIAQYQTPQIKEIPHTTTSIKEIKYRYCTECLIEGQQIDHNQLRQTLKGHGDSIVIAGSDRLIRMHIHTNQPAEVYAHVKDFGTLSQLKADDMIKQYQVTHSKHPSIALVTDSACDLPPEFIDQHDIHIIPVRISFGASTFLDKITLSPDHFYEMMETNPHHPVTSQPPPADFKNLYSFLLSHYDSIISVHLTGAASGTCRNARDAARTFPRRKISVIDGKSLSINLGFLVEEGARLIAAGKTHAEVVSAIRSRRNRHQIFVSIPSLKYLMKSGRVSKAKGVLAKLFNIKPILNLDERGMPQHYGKSFSWRGANQKVLQYIRELVSDKKNLRFKVTQVQAPAVAQHFVTQIKQQFMVDHVPVLPASPVLGAHAGKGAAAIGVTWDEA